MRVYLTLIIVAFLITGCDKIETEKVGNIHVPPGVKMRSYSTNEPNYEIGNCMVTITALPESKMNVVTYVWIENFQKGLKPTVDKLEVIPAVMFDDVAESDAKRIVSNLIHLGCSAKYEHRKQK
jgi:hypothetical protein